MELLVFISFPLVWVVAYKYFSKKRGKFISHIFGFIFAFIAFFIVAAIFLPPPTPEMIQEREQTKQKEIEENQKIEQAKQKEIEENQKIEQAKQKEIEENQKIEQAKQKEIENMKQSIAYNNTIKVIDSLSKSYNIKAKTIVDMHLSEKICLHDKYCEIYVDDIQLQFMHRVVDVNQNSKVSPKDYQTACSAVLIGLTDMNKDLAEGIIYQHFNFAAINGSAENEISNVKITINKGTNNLLQCRFVKY